MRLGRRAGWVEPVLDVSGQYVNQRSAVTQRGSHLVGPGFASALQFGSAIVTTRPVADRDDKPHGSFLDERVRKAESRAHGIAKNLLGWTSRRARLQRVFKVHGANGFLRIGHRSATKHGKGSEQRKGSRLHGSGRQQAVTGSLPTTDPIGLPPNGLHVPGV
jgi:hypothetical protein